MKSFLDRIESDLGTAQEVLLDRFLEDVQSGRVPGTVAEIEKLLQQAGDLLPLPDGSPTHPQVYNQSLRTLLSNLAGLYQEVDVLEEIQNSLLNLNSAELGRIESALRELGSLISATRQVHASRLTYNDIFFETFSGTSSQETDQRWYRPLPLLEDVGQVEAFLPAYVDPTEHNLKLQPGGSFSRAVTADGDTLVQAKVEHLLGLSLDRAHTLDRALDGQLGTYWRELITSPGPIQADPLQVPWLPETYTGGAAARLHFRFPFAVPFTEVRIRAFSQFPLHCLQLVWDNREEPKQNLLSNGHFSNGVSGWTVGLATGAATGYTVDGGFEGESAFTLNNTEGVSTLTTESYTLSGSRMACHLVLRTLVREEPRIFARVQWLTSGDVLLSQEEVEIQGPKGEWFENSFLLLPPSGWVTGSKANLVLGVEGEGQVSFARTTFSPAIGWRNLDEVPDPESDLITLSFPGALGTDLWLVLSQPHYEVAQLSYSDGDLLQQELWEQIQLETLSRAGAASDLGLTSWSLQAGENNGPEIELPQGDSRLLTEVTRLGGRVKELVSQLYQLIQPEPKAQLRNRYLYTLGAWEIQINHQEYAPHGLWVRQPYHPRGEARACQLMTDPPLSTLGRDIRFWLTARASDGTEKAQLFTGEALFFSSTERAVDTQTPHFVLPPVTRRESFEGTDRNGRVILSQHPYVNLETVWQVQTALSSGALQAPLRFDPNKALYHLYTSGSAWRRMKSQGYQIQAVNGYRPLKVWLNFPDGETAVPDTLGRMQPGDIGYSGLETLESVTQEVVYERRKKRRLRNPGDFLQGLFRRQGERPAGLDNLFNFDWSTYVRDNDPDEEDSTEEPRQRKKGDGRSRRRPQRPRTVKRIRAELHTRFPKIVSGPKGAAFSLYLHKSADVDGSGNAILSGDVLVPHKHYTLDPETGILRVHTRPPRGNPEYDTFIAYYYFFRQENSREEFEEARTGTLPTSGVDLSGDIVQTYPVTRNMTDYVRGDVRRLRPAQLDDLLPDYYPVYEYLVNEHGEVVFANNFHPYGDTPARVTVEYESLLIEPRLIVEFPKRGMNALTTETPRLRSATLLFSTRR